MNHISDFLCIFAQNLGKVIEMSRKIIEISIRLIQI